MSHYQAVGQGDRFVDPNMREPVHAICMIRHAMVERDNRVGLLSLLLLMTFI